MSQEEEVTPKERAKTPATKDTQGRSRGVQRTREGQLLKVFLSGKNLSTMTSGKWLRWPPEFSACTWGDVRKADLTSETVLKTHNLTLRRKTWHIPAEGQTTNPRQNPWQSRQREKKKSEKLLHPKPAQNTQQASLMGSRNKRGHQVNLKKHEQSTHSLMMTYHWLWQMALTKNAGKMNRLHGPVLSYQATVEFTSENKNRKVKREYELYTRLQWITLLLSLETRKSWR